MPRLGHGTPTEDNPYLLGYQICNAVQLWDLES